MGSRRRLWTPVDTTWRSTDQKVGAELEEFAGSPPGVPQKPLATEGMKRHIIASRHTQLAMGGLAPNTVLRTALACFATVSLLF